MNGTSNQLSNSTFASISTDLNNGFTSKKNKSPLKSVNKKKLTADASTCTPPNMFTLTAETFAKQQAVKSKNQFRLLLAYININVNI